MKYRIIAFQIISWCFFTYVLLLQLLWSGEPGDIIKDDCSQRISLWKEGEDTGGAQARTLE